MKRAISIICLLVFANFAVAHPFASGGGTSSSSEETDLTLILTITVVVAVGALLVTDILADNSTDSQDEISGVLEDQEEQETTGIDWEQLNQSSEEIAAPLFAISIFPSLNGKDLASYFSGLIEQGNSIYFNTYHSPVSFGNMNPEEAASTGFTYLDCQWYLAADSLNLLLFTHQKPEFLWSFGVSEWDSLSIKEAAENFLEFASTI